MNDRAKNWIVARSWRVGLATLALGGCARCGSTMRPDAVPRVPLPPPPPVTYQAPYYLDGIRARHDDSVSSGSRETSNAASAESRPPSDAASAITPSAPDAASNESRPSSGPLRTKTRPPSDPPRTENRQTPDAAPTENRADPDAARTSAVSDPTATSAVGPSVSELPGYFVVEPNLAIGGRPTLAGFRWLKGRGFRAVLDLRGVGGGEAADLSHSVGLQYHVFPIQVDSMTRELFERFNELADDGSNRPLYIYDESGKGVVALWYLHRRLLDRVPADVARRDAIAAGLGEGDTPLWAAIAAYLETAAR